MTSTTEHALHPPNSSHEEGPVAKAIEQQTSKLPSDTFLWASLGSVALALGLEATGHKEKANFVAHWAPTLLLLGVYNKIVKLHGSDGMNGKQELV